MDAVTPWPELVKRLRFLSSLKQDELAQQLGVDQGTVSRWERGTYTPDIPVQKRLRDRLHRLEPVIAPAAIEAMPVLAIMYSLHHLGLVSAASQQMAEIHGMKPEDMRYMNLEPRYSESVRSMHETLYALDGWRSCEIALVRATIFGKSGRWFRTTATLIAGADQIFFTSAPTPPPPGLDPSQCLVTVVTKDEMIS